MCEKLKHYSWLWFRIEKKKNSKTRTKTTKGHSKMTRLSWYLDSIASTEKLNKSKHTHKHIHIHIERIKDNTVNQNVNDAETNEMH